MHPTVLGKAQDSPEKIPIELKALFTIPDFPEKLVAMAKKKQQQHDRKSNRVLRQ